MTLGAEEDFKGVVDLVKMKAIPNEEDQGMSFEYADIPGDIYDKCSEMHEFIVEAAAEANEELMDVSEEETLTEAEIRNGIRQRTLSNKIIPNGSAFKNKGVQQDAVIGYLPSPTEVEPIEGELEVVIETPGKLTIMRPFLL